MSENKSKPLTESQCQESEPLTQENRKPHECFLAVNTDIFSAGPPICFKNVSYNQPHRDAPDGFEWRKFAEVIPPEVKERPDSEGVWVNEIGAFIQVFGSYTAGVRKEFNYFTFGCFTSSKIKHLPKGEWIKVPNPHGDGQ